MSQDEINAHLVARRTKAPDLSWSWWSRDEEGNAHNELRLRIVRDGHFCEGALTIAECESGDMPLLLDLHVDNLERHFEVASK